ncbi:MAG TPA: glycosyltransferase [Acidimicrobiales bacterium]|nr:glycosyltransferase [Acidimicrobiales bacterium]
MRVLFVINSLGPGGAERSLAEMLPPLADAGVQAVVACFDRRDEGSEAAVVAQGFEVHFMRAGRTAPRVSELRRLVRTVRPDIVHTAIFEADVIGRLASVGTGAAVVTSLVNTSYGPERLADPNVGAARLEACRQVDAWTARHLTDHFHAITVAVKEAAVSSLRVPGERITVVARGRDPERLGEPSEARRRRARLQLGLGDDDEVVVSVGRQEYQKGQATLLRALAGLAPDRPRLVLLLAGRRGHASDELARLADGHPLGDRLRLLGHREDVPDLLAAGDLFAFPSVYEGLGGAVIEALALGLPVVASDLPALREILEPPLDTFLVPPGDAQMLAGAVARCLDDTALRRHLSGRARQVFEERFTLERSVEGMTRLYRQVLAGTPPGGTAALPLNPPPG